MASSLLEIENIHKSFGGVKTLTAVTFSLSKGKVLGLIGPNGAGKTTVFNIISGIYRADQGAVLLDGITITNSAPVTIAKQGVARSFQVARTFNDMTVEENLRVGLVRSNLSRAETDRRVDDMLEAIGLTKLKGAMVAGLPDGQKKLLEVARAIIIPPKLLILDEPFAGVSADVVDLVIAIIHKLTASGVGCLAISHDIASMPRLCEEVLVLVEGKVLTRGPLAEVRKDQRVVEAYLGA